MDMRKRGSSLCSWFVLELSISHLSRFDDTALAAVHAPNCVIHVYSLPVFSLFFGTIYEQLLFPEFGVIVWLIKIHF